MNSPIPLRPASQVMRLDRLGAAHPTRLSFLRAMLRRAGHEAWRFSVPLWNIGTEGFGHALLQIDTPETTYTLVCFSRPLDDADRTDRVIATAWDASFVLYDGVPDAAEIARLETNAPLQEAGRFSARDLVLARANKSVRLFAHVVDRLAHGLQPDGALLRQVGYLMRTTAVYGNGKFGIADRASLDTRPEFAGPFRAEMLTVWLIRAFMVRLVEHMARARAPKTAVPLDLTLRRSLGVGNATGLGMAPFLVRHPLLIHRWFEARETALSRVRGITRADAPSRAAFAQALDDMIATTESWSTDDPVQAPRVAVLLRDLHGLRTKWPDITGENIHPWDRLYRHAEQHFSLEGQEAVVAVLLEPHGTLIDQLADTMAADENAVQRIDGTMTCGAMATLVAETYAWTERFDFAAPAEQARFWYVSEEKLEPRLGHRFEEAGADRELPLAVARDMREFAAALRDAPNNDTMAAFLLKAPQWRHLARRALIAARYPYAEIQDNLIAANTRPVDLLRAKLAFFGARNFDPRSDLWLRISLFAGLPHPDEPAQEPARSAKVLSRAS